MMANLNEEELYLLFGKAGGLLSRGEELQWENLLKLNPHAQEAYDELINALPADEVADSFARVKREDAWLDADKVLGSGKPRVINIYIKWAAASVIALIVAGGWYWQQHKPAPQLLAKEGIKLTLPDGRTIDLSAEQATISAGAAQLTSNNNTLTYIAADGKQQTGINSLTVPVGMDYKIRMEDGTEIWLNSATRLNFPFTFTGKTREVTIHGEAYLKVAKDSTRPFIVHLPNSSVLVTGTEFNVNSYDSGIVKVALVEGAVCLQSPAGESRLKPGRQAVYRTGGQIEQQVFDPQLVLSWREGIFYFRGATLEEINKVVPRWFGIRTVIDNPAILSREFVGGVDRNQPIRVFLDDLKAISRIDTYFDKDSVLHFR